MISKKALLIGFVGLVFVAGGTASVLESFGSVSGTASVERPLSIEEVYYNSNISGQDSGEYVLLENNQGSFNLSDWNLTSAGQHVELDYGVVSSDYVALVDNSTDEAKVSAPLDSNVKILEIGNLADQGLSSSEDLGITYNPEGVEVHSINYDSPGCDDSQAYNVSAEKCEKAFLEVSAR